MASREGPDQKQVADVGAGDEQDKNNHREHDFEGWEQSARVIEWRLPQGPQPDAAAAVCFRVVRLQAFGNSGNFLLCLLATHAGFEPHIRLDPSRAAILQLVATRFKNFLHRRGNPELHRPAHEGAVKALWRDADDRVEHTIESLGFPNDLRITFESSLP